MKKAYRNDRVMRPDVRSTNGRTRLEKAICAEKRAMATVREVQARLLAAVQTLATAKAQSTKEEKAVRTARAATKDLLAAKRKLRKAQKKSTRALAQNRVHSTDRASAARNSEAAAWPVAARSSVGKAILAPPFPPDTATRIHVSR